MVKKLHSWRWVSEEENINPGGGGRERTVRVGSTGPENITICTRILLWMRWENLMGAGAWMMWSDLLTGSHPDSMWRIKYGEVQTKVTRLVQSLLGSKREMVVAWARMVSHRWREEVREQSHKENTRIGIGNCIHKTFLPRIFFFL